MIQKHPDYEFELQRLDYTKQYMQRLLEESRRDVKSTQDEIRQSMADLDHLDSSLSYINILTNARFFEMARSQNEGVTAVNVLNRHTYNYLDIHRHLELSIWLFDSDSV